MYVEIISTSRYLSIFECLEEEGNHRRNSAKHGYVYLVWGGEGEMHHSLYNGIVLCIMYCMHNEAA